MGHTKRYILLPSTVVDAPYGRGSESAIGEVIYTGRRIAGNTHHKWRRDISLGPSSECGEIGNGMHGGGGWGGRVCLVVAAAGAKRQREGGVESFLRVFIEEETCNVSIR